MRVYVIFIAITLSACYQSYQAKPLQPEVSSQDLLNASPEQAGFKQYVTSQMPAAGWPVQRWDISTLTAAAIFFHPALKVVKSNYDVAVADLKVAGLKPQVGFNALVSRSNKTSDEVDPSSNVVGLSIPIVTAGKTEIAQEIAKHQVHTAEIQIGEAAWGLRNQLSLDLIDRAEKQAMLKNIAKLKTVQAALLAAYRKRLDAGMIGKSEILTIQLQYDQTASQLQQMQSSLSLVEQKIMHDAGLSDEQQSKINILSFDMDEPLRKTNQYKSLLKSSASIRKQALVNRMDIQRALATYAQAESKLKLQIAKQYPNISIDPGIEFSFGDFIWMLGINSLISTASYNDTLLTQAKQVRENEAAKFYALQYQVITLSEQSYKKYIQSAQILVQMIHDTQDQPKRMQLLERQWKAGLIDKVEWLQSQVQFYINEQRLIMQKSAVLRALLEIENAIQKPFLLSDQGLPNQITPKFVTP